ncbi:MAG: hypothetical protein WC975_02185 [Phycisphaerae bacterium]
MKYNRRLAISGAVLLAVAWLSAGRIPKEANEDYWRLVRNAGGHLSSTPGFPDAYKQMCTNSRLLQNFYLGGAGLICLAIGLTGIGRQVEPEGSDDAKPRA